MGVIFKLQVGSRTAPVIGTVHFHIIRPAKRRPSICLSVRSSRARYDPHSRTKNSGRPKVNEKVARVSARVQKYKGQECTLKGQHNVVHSMFAIGTYEWKMKQAVVRGTTNPAPFCK